MIGYSFEEYLLELIDHILDKLILQTPNKQVQKSAGTS